MLSVLKGYNITAQDITNLKTPKEIAKKVEESQSLSLNLNKYTLKSGSPLSEQQLNIYLDIVINKKKESYLVPLSMKLDKYSEKEVLQAVKKVAEAHPVLKGYIIQKDNNP